ncbi:MAG: aspartate/glutamate racemase family protein [Bacteroidales bacterium]|nr:aspartate/glutamate racemase family protein [Bacteroidales bacterium]
MVHSGMLSRVITLILVLIFVLPACSGKRNNPVGMFDSGTGGLTVLEAFLTLDEFNNITGERGADGVLDFSKEDFVFLADQVNMPYGIYNSQGKGELLKELVVNDARFLASDPFNSKIIVIACNTATANALTEVAGYLDSEREGTRVIGVINAAAEELFSASGGERLSAVGIMATEGTIASGGYERTINEIFSAGGAVVPVVVNQAGSGFAESVDLERDYTDLSAFETRENYRGPRMGEGDGFINLKLLGAYNFDNSGNALLTKVENGKIVDIQLNSSGNYARYHLVSLLEKFRTMESGVKLENIILGCTHYPYLLDTMKLMITELRDFKEGNVYPYRDLLADEVRFIDPSKYVAIETYEALKESGLLSQRGNNGSLKTFISLPNPALPADKLDPRGGFTFEFKYGRELEGLRETYVIKELSKDLIPAESLERIEKRLPATFGIMKLSDKK